METLHANIVTPSKTAYDGDIQSITLPGALGNFQVLYNHAPLMSSLEIGQIKIEYGKNEKKIFATSGGTIEVLNNKVIVLAETLESPDEIDAPRAEDAKKRAKQRIAKETDEKDIDIVRAELALRRAINRLKLFKKV